MQSKLQNQLLIATNNPDKVKELQLLLSPLPHLELVTPKMMGINLEIEETGSNYLENAIIKAQSFCKASGLPSIADDSGLEVDALAGAPGLYSARFGNVSGEVQLQYLLQKLIDVDKPNRTARFKATVVIFLPNGEYFSKLGICEGEILHSSVGMHGFGYDPLFYIPEQRKSMAQLSDQVKNQISHRAKAIQALLPEIEKYFPPPMV